MNARRARAALTETALLIAGIVIGLAIPRAAHRTVPVARGAVGDRGASPSPGQNIYSPDIRHDDHVRREQARLAELLERQCRLSGENCDLAQASRRALNAD